MMNRHSILLIFTFLSVVAFGDPVRRQLEVELEYVENSKSYEIELTKFNPDGSRKQPVSFKTSSNKWQAKLTPGKYTVRSRSIDSRGVPGSWGSVQELIVRFPKVEAEFPKSGENVKSLDPSASDLDFKWKAQEGIQKYRVTVFTQKGESFTQVEVTGNSAKINLPSGQKYTWQVLAVQEGGIDGEVDPPSPFTFFGPKLEKPQVYSPSSTNVSLIEWSAPEFVTKYDYIFESMQPDGSWKVVDKARLNQNLRSYGKLLASGKYRVSVRALGELRESSDTVTLEFDTKQNRRSLAAIEQMKSESSYQSQGPLYAVATYYVSYLYYSKTVPDAVYSENNVDKRWQGYDAAFAGTGRVGLGSWFSPKSSIGILGSAELSGFAPPQEFNPTQKPLAPENIYYWASTLQVTFRYRAGALGQIRGHLGYSYFSVPEVSVTKDSTGYVLSKREFKMTGPVGGLSLARAFSRKFGLQLNFYTLYPLSSTGLGAREQLIPSLNFQGAMLASYRLDENWLGMAGVAYKEDAISYSRYTPTGVYEEQKIRIWGYFLNLALEYGF